MYIGTELISGVFVERIQAGRWLVRSTLNADKTPVRVGEILGRAGKYVAFTMKGDRVSESRTLKSSVGALSQRET